MTDDHYPTRRECDARHEPISDTMKRIEAGQERHFGELRVSMIDFSSRIAVVEAKLDAVMGDEWGPPPGARSRADASIKDSGLSVRQWIAIIGALVALMGGGGVLAGRSGGASVEEVREVATQAAAEAVRAALAGVVRE